MRVAIVHDDLVQWGGAERVLEGLLEIYPEATLFTSVYDSNNQSLSRLVVGRDVRTSFLQKIPFWKQLYKVLLPLYPIAFEQFNFDEYDLVISHTTRFAKSIITKPATKHISYCHTPPRFLWHFSGMKNYGFGEFLMTKLRIYDQVTVHRVDYFIAGSENAKRRIKKIYGVDSKVVYPFVDLKRFEGIDSFDGGYFVIAGRMNKYKRFDLAIDVCNKLGIELLRNGDRVREHLDRFITNNEGKKGKYVSLMLHDYVVVDIRASASGDVTSVQKDEHRISIFFKNGNFSSCNCIFGLNDAITLSLSN